MSGLHERVARPCDLSETMRGNTTNSPHSDNADRLVMNVSAQKDHVLVGCILATATVSVTLGKNEKNWGSMGGHV